MKDISWDSFDTQQCQYFSGSVCLSVSLTRTNKWGGKVSFKKISIVLT